MSSDLGNAPPLSVSQSIQSIEKPSRDSERNQENRSKHNKDPKRNPNSNSNQPDVPTLETSLQGDAFEASNGGTVITSSDETDENAPKRKKGLRIDVKI